MSTKAYRDANREKVSAGQKVWRDANREKVISWDRAYREANREKRRSGQKAYREANREKSISYIAGRGEPLIANSSTPSNQQLSHWQYLKQSQT
jgi:hypothetical protein